MAEVAGPHATVAGDVPDGEETQGDVEMARVQTWRLVMDEQGGVQPGPVFAVVEMPTPGPMTGARCDGHLDHLDDSLLIQH